MPDQGLSLRHRAGLAEASTRVAVRLGLLGGFELDAGDRRIRLPLHVQRLLAFLALQGRPLHRSYVAGRLWIDLSEERSHACLRTALWRLGRRASPVVEVTGAQLLLAPDVAVDVRELETCADRVMYDDPPPTVSDVNFLSHAADLLPDWYDDWLLDERERLLQVRLAALEAAAEQRILAQRYAEAAIAAGAAVRSDPLRESANRLLVRSYLGEGNTAEALRQFAEFRADLGRLGLEPSLQMHELVGRIQVTSSGDLTSSATEQRSRSWSWR